MDNLWICIWERRTIPTEEAETEGTLALPGNLSTGANGTVEDGAEREGRADGNNRGGKKECRTEEPSPTRGCGIAFPEETTRGGERWTEETLLHRPVLASREGPQKEDYGSLILRLPVCGPIRGVTIASRQGPSCTIQEGSRRIRPRVPPGSSLTALGPEGHPACIRNHPRLRHQGNPVGMPPVSFGFSLCLSSH